MGASVRELPEELYRRARHGDAEAWLRLETQAVNEKKKAKIQLAEQPAREMLSYLSRGTVNEEVIPQVGGDR